MSGLGHRYESMTHTPLPKIALTVTVFSVFDSVRLPQICLTHVVHPRPRQSVTHRVVKRVPYCMAARNANGRQVSSLVQFSTIWS